MGMVPGGEMKEDIRKPGACVDMGEGGGWQVLSAYSAKKGRGQKLELEHGFSYQEGAVTLAELGYRISSKQDGKCRNMEDAQARYGDAPL